MGSPRRGWRTFTRSDFIRVPFPAARIMVAMPPNLISLLKTYPFIQWAIFLVNPVSSRPWDRCKGIERAELKLTVIRLVKILDSGQIKRINEVKTCLIEARRHILRGLLHLHLPLRHSAYRFGLAKSRQRRDFPKGADANLVLSAGAGRKNLSFINIAATSNCLYFYSNFKHLL